MQIPPTFCGQLLHVLTWGPPYWPEITLGLTAVLCALWLAYRIRNASKAKKDKSAQTEKE